LVGDRPGLGVEGLVDLDDELGKRPQPREPGIAHDEVEESGRSRDFAERFLVSDPLGIEQGFVQGEQRLAEAEQALPRGLFFRVDEGFHGLDLLSTTTRFFQARA
jgi:hypothetical protein